MYQTSVESIKNPDGSLGYTWNPITGCLNHVDGLCKGGGFPCYAYKLANGRLKKRYLANKNVAPRKIGTRILPRYDPFYPRFWEERLLPLHTPRRADSPKKGIFVCDMSELFGGWIPQSWQEQVFNAIKANPDYRFYLLTKQPQNLVKWSPFPDNCYVGVTATNTEMFLRACTLLEYPLQAKLKYLSLEPLLDWSFNWNASYLVNTLERADIGWLIIGACTGTYNEMQMLRQWKGYPDLTIKPYGKLWTAQPKIEWVREIVEAADKAGVRVFLKDNLKPLFSYPEHDWAWGKYDNGVYTGLLRQEMPE